MGLISPALPWILWITAAGLFLFIVASWPRAARPGARALLRRVCSLLAVMTVTVAAIGVSLNREYDWYTSWSDLASSIGDAAPSQTVEHAGASPAAAAERGHAAVLAPPVGGLGNGRGDGGVVIRPRGAVVDPVARTPLDLRSDPGPDGQYHGYQVRGPSGVSSFVLVWFPQSYTDRADANRRYPVIEAFHGIPGSPLQLEHSVRLGESVAAAVRAGAMRDAIVVMPFINPGGTDTECVNGGQGQLQMESWLTQDVPNWAQANMRVQPGRDSWATWGFSEGGWCAAMAAMLHPGTYSAAIVLGGYFHPMFDPGYVPFAPGSAAWKRYDLATLAESAPPPIALWMQTSAGDPLSYPTSTELLAWARAPLSLTVDDMSSGGHRMSVWMPLLPGTLAWLGSSIPGFAPLARH